MRVEASNLAQPPERGYQASRGFARVPIVTRGAVRVIPWASGWSGINPLVWYYASKNNEVSRELAPIHRKRERHALALRVGRGPP